MTSLQAITVFNGMAQQASKLSQVGGYPTFEYAHKGRDHVWGGIFVDANSAQWHDVPLSKLGNPDLTDFAGRMRATANFAYDGMYLGGWPTFYHADYGKGVVCGTVLLKPGVGQWRDVPLADLGNPDLDDVGARFRATHHYARQQGFVGGFPNFHHADYGNGVVCGTVLLNAGPATWKDIVLGSDPA